ncbi:PREDICTED: protein CNPPD1 [Nanorana parkeri]|uniref:protein CNPPD1 n=1 Tax=Nanorana parkeri TaxID=125878 RepID=UPI00085443FE|nr:PREDICTED: protein CNPPD1 [Nanorana parkeri]
MERRKVGTVRGAQREEKAIPRTATPFMDFPFLPGHPQLAERVRKRLYYGWDAECSMENLSSPVADIAVELLQKAAPSPIRRLQKKYAVHVSREACISPCSMMLALVYIERLRHRNPEYLQQISSSDLFLISMVSSEVRSCDLCPPVFFSLQSHWGLHSKPAFPVGQPQLEVALRVAHAGIRMMHGTARVTAAAKKQTIFIWSRADCHPLTWRFFVGFASAQYADWGLYTHPGEFFEVLRWLEGSVAEQQGMKRGWFTYTDLSVLLEQELWQKVFNDVCQQVTKVACILGLVYLTGVATLFASVAVLHKATWEINGTRLLPITGPIPDVSVPLFFPAPLEEIPATPTTVLPCSLEEECTERKSSVTATALYLWGSVLTALTYKDPGGTEGEELPPPGQHCPYCSKPKPPSSQENTTRCTSNQPLVHAFPGLDLYSFPDLLVCSNCPNSCTIKHPERRHSPDHESETRLSDTLEIKTSICTDASLGRLKTFIVPG